jgi:hypothetical protein
MRRILLLLCTLAFALSSSVIYAQDGSSDDGGGLHRRSIDNNPFDTNPESYPGGPAGKAPLSTGYYVVDNDAPSVPALWTPTYSFVDTTGVDARSWRRIRSGPNQVPMSDWTAPGSQGKEFFMNPSVPNDSTDNAIAGPINIGFPFYYYGRAYDSFYVSTNGLIALANRRYQYDDFGNRVDYNPFRDDTLVRPRLTGSAVTDPTPDDYGFTYVAMGNTASPLGGIRNPNNGQLPVNGMRNIIAAAWDDLELSQFDTTTGLVDDFGRVYWRRDNAGNRLIIYYVNASMKGLKNIPLIGTTAIVPRRLLRANFQIVLDRIDSSIQFNYVRYLGQYTDPVQRILTIPTAQMLRANATIGLQSNQDVPAPYTGATGAEYTNYQFNDFPGVGTTPVNGDPTSTPHAGLAVKFRQWPNKVRVMRVDFQIPNRADATQFTTLPQGAIPDNYELLLGNPLLGVIRPVGVVQNTSDSIGPVNRTRQPVIYNIIFRIRDIVNCTAPPVYQKTNSTDSLHPIRLGGGTKPHTDTIVFDPYVTNAQLTKQAGRFRAEVIATDRGPSGEVYGDVWPFDDTTGVRIFGIFRQEIPYITTFSDFSVSCEDGVIPNVKRWVSIGAQVVDGDQNTWNPPPPRGPANGSNGNLTLQSPVAKMDRQNVEGAYYQGAPRGDTLVSFPVNISLAQSPTIYVNYQRAGKKTYPRGWSDQVRVGPEQAVYNTLKTTVLQQYDALMVEFAEPSPNGIDNITNVRQWRHSAFGDPTGAPRWGSDAPRWGVFGGGGGSGLDTTGKIVVNEFDAGKDFEFYRAYIPIPQRWFGNINTNKTFRFRLKVEARDHRDPIIPADDEDAFYVDNIYLTNIDKPELEVTAVGARWPYTIAPASQARAIPLYVKVANNGSTAATAFGVAMYVQPLGAQTPGVYKYYRFRSIISLAAGRDRTEFFPTWNAQECGTEILNPDSTRMYSQQYRIFAELLPKGLDAYSANDLNYNDFTLTLGSVFAYDDTSRRQGRNDVPQFSGVFGKGLNLVAPAEDPAAAQPYGPLGGNLAGSFAVRFDIQTRDTIRGFQAYFGSANQSPDYILYSLYRGKDGQPNSPPDTVIQATRRFARRGEGTPTIPPTLARQFNWDQYITYHLDTFYVVDPGIYFISISQLGETGLELGASALRQGQVTTIYDPNSTPQGIGNYSIPAHPEMLEQRFWFETIAETGNWVEMLQPTTNPGYPHLNFGGVVAMINTYSRGSWIPMVRPYFGPKESGSCTVEPVELADFKVTPLATALHLSWVTATEIDNKGFHVERRVKNGDDNWNAITFVQGAGTSNREQKYSFTDANVNTGVTYQYRLVQEDVDGTVSTSDVREGRLAGAATGAIANRLEQNSPNPFTDRTSISYSIADGGNATLSIVDVYGNTVRTFSVAGNGNVQWDGTDANGNRVGNGVYVYKLSGEGFNLTKKMTITR